MMRKTMAPHPHERSARPDQRIVIRATTLTLEEATRVEQAAEAAGLPVSDYIRARLLESREAPAPEPLRRAQEAGV
jgi:hypothetical protein